eukprot:gene39132-47609_t
MQELHFQSFTTEEFYKICNRISKFKQLESIVLDGCKLTQEDARSLTQSLRKLSSLRYLSLCHCGIEDEHMKSLSLLAKSPGNITCWDLSDNHLTSESYDSLYKILVGSTNSTLEMLDISYNKVGGILVGLLEESSRKSKLKNLQRLNCKQVGLSGRTSLKLLDLLNSSAPLLHHLDLSGNTLISDTTSLNKQSSVKSLLSEYTKANGQLLADALNSLTSSLSASGSSVSYSVSSQTASKKNKVSKKSPSKSKASAKIISRKAIQKKKKDTVSVISSAVSTRQLLASRLLSMAKQRRLRYLGLCKTGLDAKFGQALAQAAEKITIPTSADAGKGDSSASHGGSGSGEAGCVVDVRLNDINGNEVDAIVKKVSLV